MIAELSALRDDMYRYPMRLAHETAYAGHPYSNPAGGTEESLRAIAATRLREWYATRLCAAPYVMAMVGDCRSRRDRRDARVAFTELRWRGAASDRGPPMWPA